MIARTGRYLIAALVLLFAATVASAQQNSQGPGPVFTQQELDQILAPIALYPDALLSQIMMAATYPDDIIDAAQWSRRNSELNGDRAVRAVERYDWDPSVKSLVAFPQILDMMDAKINWTEDLGDAFLAQQAQVMDTVQYLRRQAYTAGNLQSSDQFRVDVRDSSFVIEFANADMAYLPYYNPVVVYGTWWWPTHQPVYWAPWPGYYSRVGYRGFAWGPPIPVSRGFFYGAPDWQHRRINIVNTNNYYYRAPNTNREAPRNVAAGAPTVWQHDAAHRRDVPQRDAGWRQPAARVDSAPDARRDARPATSQPMAAAPMPNAARAEPARGVESRGNDARGNDPRGAEGRGDRMQRHETRFDAGNRAADRGSVQPATAAPVVERAPVAVSAPPVVTQARVTPAPMPMPTPVPTAASHATAEPRATAAAAPRAPDGGNRRPDPRQAGSHERDGRPAPAENTVAAAPAAQAGGNWRGNGGNSGGNSRHRE